MIAEALCDRRVAGCEDAGRQAYKARMRTYVFFVAIFMLVQNKINIGKCYLAFCGVCFCVVS